MINKMDTELNNGEMELNMKVTTKMAKSMGKVNLHGRIKVGTREISLKMKCRVKANKFGQMEDFMRVDGTKG